MLVTDHFVFVHIPKTGGTFVERVIRPVMPANQYLSRHSAYRRLPAELQHLPAFCIVRNPWDWYVSWFHHSMEIGDTKSQGRQKLVIWEDVLRSGRADFKEAVIRACTGDFDHSLAAVVRQDGTDLYSAYVKTLVGSVLDDPNFTVIRFERMRRQLVRYLSSITDVPQRLRESIRNDPPNRTSTHGHYAEYYDDELRRLVGQKTMWLRRRFGYRFARRTSQDGGREEVSEAISAVEADTGATSPDA